MRYLFTYLLTLLCVISASGQIVVKKETPIKYLGVAEVSAGVAYNLNTSETISTNNMQMLWAFSTSHGFVYKGLFGGLGFGYNHSQRDKENMYLIYTDIRYAFEKCKLAPFIGVKGGIIYDPYWIEKVKPYGAVGINVNVYKALCFGLEGSVFARPSRHFTANAFVVVGYTLGCNFSR